jgi:hypothetical protein
VSFSQRDENSSGNNLKHEDVFDAKIQEFLISNSKSGKHFFFQKSRMALNLNHIDTQKNQF